MVGTLFGKKNTRLWEQIWGSKRTVNKRVNKSTGSLKKCKYSSKLLGKNVISLQKKNKLGIKSGNTNIDNIIIIIIIILHI